MAYKFNAPLVVADGGTGATTLTGVLTGNGTGAVTANTVTQYAVLLGDASNGVTNVATVGASGEVLTSNGAGLAPTWQAAGGGGITTINGDSGSITGDPVTFTGGTSGAIFTGSGSTMTQSFDYLALPTTTSTDGQVTINGSRFMHSYGTDNTFLGTNAGNFTLTGSSCVGIGSNVLNASTGTAYTIGIGESALSSALNGGYGCVAIGREAMALATDNFTHSIAIGKFTLRDAAFVGTDCIAIGQNTLFKSSTGDNKIGLGRNVMFNATTGAVDSVAIGYLALNGVTTGGSKCVAIGSNALVAGERGSFSIGIGDNAGSVSSTGSSCIYFNNTGAAESNTLRIGAATGTGNQQLNKAFIHGIRGITTGVADAINVLVDSAGQLGTVSSSIRYKENVEDMGGVSSGLKDLRPVTFDYKDKPSHKKQVGLIAEEVEKVMPSLVVYNQDGEVETVKYHELPTLLLNELQKALKRIEVLEQKLQDK